MSDLDYDPSLSGWVPFGTVGLTTATVTPQVGDSLFVRYGGTFNVAMLGIPLGTSLGIGGLVGEAPIVLLDRGASLAVDVAVAAGGTLELGNPSGSNPANPARFEGGLSVAVGGRVVVTDGQFAGPIDATGTIEVRDSATLLAGAALTLVPTQQTLPFVVDASATVTIAGTIATGTLVGILTNMDANYTPLFNGALHVSGTIDNNGTQIDPSGFGGLSISGATVLGGTLLGGGVVQGVTIDGAAIAGSLTTSAGSTNEITGTIGGVGTLVVDGALGFLGTVHLDPVTVLLGSGGSLFSAGVVGLEVGPQGRISFAGPATVSLAGASAATIDGTLDLGVNAAPVTIDWRGPGGSIAVTNLATVSLGVNTTFLVEPTFSQAGTLALEGGTLDLVGTATLDTIAFGVAGSTLVLGQAGEGGHLLNFADGDSVVFSGAADIGASLSLAGNTLEVRSSGGSLDGRFVLERSDAGTYNANDFNLSIEGNSLALSTTGVAIAAAMPCFAAGTAIETERGPAPVEVLAPGWLVRTATGALRDVVWVGRQTVRLGRHPRPWDVNPVRIRAEAFGPELPRRDLVLSPDHAVFMEGALIPVRYLLNGATVIQEAWERVTWHHIELASHDVILAEGLPAETYLDTGNRAALEGNVAAVHLHPDFAREAWERGGFAPLLTGGERVVSVRRMLLNQAQVLGYALDDDPALEVVPLLDGVVLRSRSFVPALSLADSEDHRRLGVAVKGLRIDGVVVPLDDPRLDAGWHQAEEGWRWSDGAGHIAVRPGSRVEIDLLPPGCVYWVDLTSFPTSAANARS